MSSIDRFALFTEVREYLGRVFVRALEGGLPELADGLERAAEASPSLLGRRELFTTAAMLRIEAAGRTDRGLGAFYDVSFRLLELGQSGAAGTDTAPPTLLPDHDPEARMLADAIAQAMRDRLGPRYPTWIRRIDGLTRQPVIDARTPLGAATVAQATVEALRPMAVDRALRSTLRQTALERLVPWLCDALGDCDDWLAARGAMPWEPPPVALEVAHPADPPAIPSRPLADATPTPAPGSATGGGVAASERLPREPTPPAPTAGDAAPIEAPSAGEASLIATPPIESPSPESPSPESPSPESPSPESPTAVVRVHDAEPSAVDPAAPAATDAPDASMVRAAEALIHDTEVADLLGHQPIAPSARAESGYRFAGVLPRPAALEQDGIAFAHHVGVAPYSRGARQQFFASVRQRMLEAHATPAHLATHDLVAAMFDYAIDDARIAEAAKPLLWRLQLPAVTLAALDAGFLGDDRRSMRRLVEHFAAISTAYADDIALGSELHRRLDTVVRAVEVICHAFQTRSSVLGDQVRREYGRAAQSVAQLLTRVEKERRALEATPARRNRRDFARRPSAGRETEVTRRLQALLGERVAGRDVPESVRDFLLGAWVRHLRTAVLRDGDDSASFRLSMQVVDDLLWTLDDVGGRPSRRHLARRIPPLLKLLTQGIRDIGGRPDEYRPFLDELFVIHLRRMQKVPRNGSDETTRAGETGIDTDVQADPAGLPPTLQDRIPDAAGATATPAKAPPTAPAPPPAPAPSPATTPGAGTTPAPSPSAVPPVSASPPKDAPPPISPVLSMPSAAARMAAPPDRPVAPTVPVVVTPALHERAPATDAREVPAAPSGDPSAGAPTVAPIESEPTGGADGTIPPPPIVAPEPPIAAPDDRSGEQRLLTVLSTVDLSDFPLAPRRLTLAPDDALARLRRGDWLELLGRDGQPQEVKVAWINSRRTVVLLVRRPDRRALSLRAAELHQRFAQHKATLLA